MVPLLSAHTRASSTANHGKWCRLNTLSKLLKMYGTPTNRSTDLYHICCVPFVERYCAATRLWLPDPPRSTVRHRTLSCSLSVCMRAEVFGLEHKVNIHSHNDVAILTYKWWVWQMSDKALQLLKNEWHPVGAAIVYEVEATLYNPKMKYVLTILRRELRGNEIETRGWEEGHKLTAGQTTSIGEEVALNVFSRSRSSAGRWTAARRHRGSTRLGGSGSGDDPRAEGYCRSNQCAPTLLAFK